MIKNLRLVLFLLIIPFFLGSCNLTKLLTEEQVLLESNKIKGVDKKLAGDLRDQIRHRPNRELLGVFKFHLWVYKFASVWKVNKFNNYIKEHIGEKPVLLDSSKIELSARNMELYLFNNGYLNAEVDYKTNVFLKRATVTYMVDTKKPYTIEDINRFSNVKSLAKPLREDLSQSFLKKGKIIDFDDLAKERERITNQFRNSGFYYFNKEFIDFQLDSNSRNNTVKVTLRVKSDYENGGSEKFITPQTIDTIRVILEHDIPGFMYRPEAFDTVQFNQIYFIMNGFPLKPYVVSRNIHLKPGELFMQKNLENTYSRLVAMGLFKFININFERSHKDSFNKLNVTIKLIPSNKQEFIIEPQAITTDQNDRIQNENFRNYGIAVNFQYRNKNIFKNAELLDIRVRSTVEAQARGRDSTFNRFFNSFEQSVNASLTFPKLVLLKKLDEKSGARSTQTIVNLSYIYETNIDFNRKVLPASLTYQINHRLISWFITPAQVSFNRPLIKSDFLDSLNTSNSIFVRNLFTDNLIIGSRVGFVYSDRNFTNNKTSVYLKWNILELAGNSLFAFHELTNQKFLAGDNFHRLFGVKYFQFAKTDIDLRFNTVLNENNTTAFRVLGGIGVPFGNTPNQLPFEKRFFIGGSTSLRAWRPRNMGPGSFVDTAQIQLDRSGEIILQSNFEYRFKIIQNLLEGAWFMDGGNVWNITKDPLKPGAHLDFKTLYREIALNTGLGIRVDFSFFLLRLDWGLRLRDPIIPEIKRWTFRNSQSNWLVKNSVLNLGIGYPF